MTLTIGKTVIGGDVLENDYVVKEDGYSCGRIRLGVLTGSKPVWQFFVNPPLPVTAGYNGTAETLEDARDQFKASWARFRASLTDHDVQHWHHIADAAKR